MGASLSLILAAYVTDHIIDAVIPVLSFNLIFIKQYVDDIILALPEDEIEGILFTINDYDPYIQFAIQKEDDENSVPFLDNRLIRHTDNTLKIEWYRKPCH